MSIGYTYAYVLDDYLTSARQSSQKILGVDTADRVVSAKTRLSTKEQMNTASSIKNEELKTVLIKLISLNTQPNCELWTTLNLHMHRLNFLSKTDLLAGALEALEDAGIQSKLFHLLQTPQAERQGEFVRLATKHFNRCIVVINFAKELCAEILTGGYTINRVLKVS